MTFDEVIGQEPVKARLRAMQAEGSVPHAMLFCGASGVGKMPMALAFATQLLGESRMTQTFAHPDLHFVFPVIRQKGQSSEATSDQYLGAWREMLQESPYFDQADWLSRMQVENQQALIGVAESGLILRKLSIKSSQGGYKVMIVWLPELMNQEAANRLLKILEEPPGQTVFILVSNQPERLLPTILSRTRRVAFPPLTENEIATALMQYHALGEVDAHHLAHLSEGSYTQAQHLLMVDSDRKVFFDLFVALMRLCYQRRIKELSDWADQLAGWGRERQKAFLQYCQHLIRENFVYNFHQPALNYETSDEAEFSTRFARFINEGNVIGITDELADAERDIESNVNARMVFFDLTLKMTVLLLQKT